MVHKHYSGFALDENTLKLHMRIDHGLTDEQIDDIEDLAADHIDQHPEIKAPQPPSNGDLAQQLVAMQSAVDDLVLTSLLG